MREGSGILGILIGPGRANISVQVANSIHREMGRCYRVSGTILQQFADEKGVVAATPWP